MLDLCRSIESTIGQFIRELPDTRGRTTLNYGEDGAAYLKGATDTNGYLACGVGNCRKKYPCKKHGAHGEPIKIAGRSIDSTHSAYGYTDSDLTALRQALIAEGVTLQIPHIEAALLQAKHEGIKMPKTPEQKRADARERKARQRERKRAEGYCIVCTVNAAAFNEQGEQLATCRECGEAANERTRRRKNAP